MPKKVEEIVKALMKGGKSEQSAYAIANSIYNKKKKKKKKKSTKKSHKKK